MGKPYRQRHYHNHYRSTDGKFDQTWTFAERELIMDPEKPPDHVLAEQLGRTIGSIQAERRREKQRRQQS